MATTRAPRVPRAPATLAAYVLHHYDWSESSLILDLFTREQGRLAIAAKGAKRPHSQLRSVLLPFQRIHVSLGRVPSAEVSSDVQTLRGAEWAGGGAMLGGAALFSGFYANELLMKLLARNDPHPALFDAYAQTLLALGGDEALAQSALRAFELTLLRQIGLLPELNVVTLTQQPVQDAARYGLLPEAGVQAARGGDGGNGGSDGELAGATLIGLEAALTHGSLPALQQACGAALAGLKTSLRALLHYHLGSSSLRTRQVMQDLQHLDR